MIRVKIEEFLEAAAKSPRRGRHKVPKDTALSSDGHILKISTPAMDTFIQGDGSFQTPINVDAQELVRVLQIIKEKDGSVDGAIQLVSDGQTLKLIGKTEITIKRFG